MLSKRDKLTFATTSDDYQICLDKPSGLWCLLQFSEYYKNPYFSIVFGPGECRQATFVSIKQPKYIVDDCLLDSNSKEIFINAVKDKWNELKNNKLYSRFIPDTIPDYSKLKTREER